MNRRLATVSVLAAAVVSLVACGESTAGIASPAAGGGRPTTATNGGGAPASGVPSRANASPLASIKPCGLLSQSVIAQLQLHYTKSGDDSGARYCDYQKNVDENGDNGWAVGVNVRDEQGLATVSTNGYTVASHPIGTHQGEELRATGDCIIVIGVSATSRVDVTASATTDTDQACQVARTMADVVGPQLPAGG